MKVLHISAHYGGGVGTVMNAWKNNDRRNEHVFTHLHKSPLNEGMLFDASMVERSDAVICHVWNHPSVFDFLLNTPLPPCRFVIWSHVSGLYPPDVYSEKLIGYADKFVFTTPLSYESEEVLALPAHVRSGLTVIWSTYDIGKYSHVKKAPHDGFNIGYIGTADYGKLHPQFIDMCANVKAPAHFIVCSHDSQEHLKARAKALGAYHRFDFCGRIPDVAECLARYDILGYPLQPSHFGSCEQAIGEAMACGVVPVVMGNPTERYVVKHMETGIVAETTEDYSLAIDYLYNNRRELKRMARNARAEAMRRYDIKRTVSQWGVVLSDVMKLEKRERRWSQTMVAPSMVYAASLGKHGKPFADYVFADYIGSASMRAKAIADIRNLYASNSAFLSSSKGSIRQYLQYVPFAFDAYLRHWDEIADGMRNERREGRP